MSDGGIRKHNSNKNPYTSVNIVNWYQIQQTNIRVGLMVLDLAMFVLLCVQCSYRELVRWTRCAWHGVPLFHWKQVFHCWEWPVNKLIVFGIRCNQFVLSKNKTISRSRSKTNIIYLRHSINNWNSLFSSLLILSHLDINNLHWAAKPPFALNQIKSFMWDKSFDFIHILPVSNKRNWYYLSEREFEVRPKWWELRAGRENRVCAMWWNTERHKQREIALASSLSSIALIHFDSLNRKWN